jgi:glycosyltransferase involved in cell wall biosynthesis
VEETSMKHILCVTTSFPDAAFEKGQEAAGGFVADFALALSRFVRVTALAPSSKSSVEEAENLTIHRFSVPYLPLSLLKIQNPAHWTKILKTLITGQKATAEVAMNTPIDHIFALWALPSGYWAYRVKQKLGIPYSIWALGSDIWSLKRVPIIRNVLRTILRSSKHRYADGLLLADDVKEISGLDCKFLPSSRELLPKEKKRLSTQPPYRLAFLGRWHRNKGIDLLLDSLKILPKEDWKKIESVQICGGGALEDLVKRGVSELKANGRPIVLRGYLNQDEARDLLTWADYLLLPSRIESIPVIFSDAMQNHCPIISAPVGDLPRLMRRYHVGELAQDVTSEDFVIAIRQAINSTPVKYESGLENAKAQFDVKQCAKRFSADLF